MGYRLPPPHSFDWMVDLLHVDLNEGKLTWKWALVRNLPADVRHEISALLISYGLGLDLRTKEEGRVAQDKFYDGGEWHKFISGSKKSPRGERIIAEIVLIVATHYERLLKSAEADRLARVAAPPAPAASQPKKSARNPKPASSKPTKASRGGKHRDSTHASLHAFQILHVMCTRNCRRCRLLC